MDKLHDTANASQREQALAAFRMYHLDNKRAVHELATHALVLMSFLGDEAASVRRVASILQGGSGRASHQREWRSGATQRLASILPHSPGWDPTLVAFFRAD